MQEESFYSNNSQQLLPNDDEEIKSINKSLNKQKEASSKMSFMKKVFFAFLSIILMFILIGSVIYVSQGQQGIDHILNIPEFNIKYNIDKLIGVEDGRPLIPREQTHDDIEDKHNFVDDKNANQQRNSFVKNQDIQIKPIEAQSSSQQQYKIGNYEKQKHSPMNKPHESQILHRQQVDDMIKPFTDKRSYRFLQLKNKLRVLLVSDPESTRAGAALRVNVGASSEPIGGLAHFLEHMLFLGSKKYPVLTHFKQNLSKSGGKSNAFTSDEFTTYYFNVLNHNLEEMLEIWSRFFIDPLFDPSSTQKEINAVNSEYENNLDSNAWRFLELVRKQANPKHPFYKFVIGNIETLKTEPENQGLQIHEELIKFYNQHYSSEKMTLVLMGNFDLEQLEEWAVKKFQEIPIGQHPNGFTQKKQQAFQLDNIGRFVWYQPIGSQRTITLVFPVPFPESEDPNYLISPLKYIGFLLTDKGEDGLFQFLRKMGWVNGIATKSMSKSNDFTLFVINMVVTQRGMDQSIKICETIFAYLRLIADYGLTKDRFQQYSFLSYLQFLYSDRSNIEGFMLDLVAKLHEQPIEHILLRDKVTMEFSPNVLKNYLEHLVPDKSLIIFGSSQYEADAVFDTVRLKQKVSSSYQGKKDFLEQQDDQQVGWTVAQPQVKIDHREVFLKEGNKFESVDQVLDEIFGKKQQRFEEVQFDLKTEMEVNLNFRPQFFELFKTQMKNINLNEYLNNFSNQLDGTSFMLHQHARQQQSPRFSQQFDGGEDLMPYASSTEQDQANYYNTYSEEFYQPIQTNNVQQQSASQNIQTLQQQFIPSTTLQSESQMQEQDTDAQWGWQSRNVWQQNLDIQLSDSKRLNKYERIMKFFFASEKISGQFLKKMGSSYLETIQGITAQLPQLNKFVPDNLDMLSDCPLESININAPQNAIAVKYLKLIEKTKFTTLINDLLDEKFRLKPNYSYNQQCFAKDIMRDKVVQNPQLIQNDTLSEVWIKSDRSYAIPKATIKILIQSSRTYSTIQDAIKASILESIIKEAMHKDFADAQFLGFELSIDMQFQGLTLSFSGYSSVLPKLVDLTISTIINPQFSDGKLQAIKSSLIRDLNTQNSGITNNKLISDLNHFLRQYFYSPEQIIPMINQITFYEMNLYKRQIFERAYLKFLFVGNILNHKALDISQNVISKLGSYPEDPSNLYQDRILDINRLDSFTVRQWNQNPQDSNHAIFNYYQIGPLDLKGNSILQYIQLFFHSEAFLFLRTHHQLGYLVQGQTSTIINVKGLTLKVQGTVKNPHQMDQLIEEFLQNFERFLQEKPDSEFPGYNALPRSRSNRSRFNDATLDQKASRFWDQILNGEYDFGYDFELREEMGRVTKQECLDFWFKYMRTNSKKISIQYYSQKNSKGGELPKDQLTSTYAGNSNKIIRYDTKIQSSSRYPVQKNMLHNQHVNQDNNQIWINSELEMQQQISQTIEINHNMNSESQTNTWNIDIISNNQNADIQTVTAINDHNSTQFNTSSVVDISISQSVQDNSSQNVSIIDKNYDFQNNVTLNSTENLIILDNNSTQNSNDQPQNTIDTQQKIMDVSNINQNATMISQNSNQSNANFVQNSNQNINKNNASDSIVFNDKLVENDTQVVNLTQITNHSQTDNATIDYNTIISQENQINDTSNMNITQNVMTNNVETAKNQQQINRIDSYQQFTIQKDDLYLQNNIDNQEQSEQIQNDAQRKSHEQLFYEQMQQQEIDEKRNNKHLEELLHQQQQQMIEQQKNIEEKKKLDEQREEEERIQEELRIQIAKQEKEKKIEEEKQKEEQRQLKLKEQEDENIRQQQEKLAKEQEKMKDQLKIISLGNIIQSKYNNDNATVKIQTSNQVQNDTKYISDTTHAQLYDNNILINSLASQQIDQQQQIEAKVEATQKIDPLEKELIESQEMVRKQVPIEPNFIPEQKQQAKPLQRSIDPLEKELHESQEQVKKQIPLEPDFVPIQPQQTVPLKMKIDPLDKELYESQQMVKNREPIPDDDLKQEKQSDDSIDSNISQELIHQEASVSDPAQTFYEKLMLEEKTTELNTSPEAIPQQNINMNYEASEDPKYTVTPIIEEVKQDEIQQQKQQPISLENMKSPIIEQKIDLSEQNENIAVIPDYKEEIKQISAKNLYKKITEQGVIQPDMPPTEFQQEKQLDKFIFDQNNMKFKESPRFKMESSELETPEIQDNTKFVYFETYSR